MLKNVIFTILFVLLSCFFVHAQPPPVVSGESSVERKIAPTFTSIEGEFKIDIPNDVRGYAGLRLRDTNNLGTGAIFKFSQPEAEYQIGYIDLKPSIEKMSDKRTRQIFDDLQKNVIDKMFVTDRAVKSIKDFKFKYHPADQFTAKVPSGNIIVRHILDDDKIYILMAKFASDDKKPQILKRFDSIEFISTKEIIEKKLNQATPAPLPQTPVVKRFTSDAQEENLKGKVKYVLEESEDLSGERYFQGRKYDSEDFYDASGNRTKRIFYNYRNLPMSVTVYGYINEARVSKHSSIFYESDPPAAVALPSNLNQPAKPKDKRFTVKTVYKYDSENRLEEVRTFRNDGDSSGKTVYEYADKKLEKSSFDAAGKLTAKTIDIYDDKGNVIEKTFVSTQENRPDSVYRYTYSDFDEKGNWTKRIVEAKLEKFGGGHTMQKYVEYRKIDYYN